MSDTLRLLFDSDMGAPGFGWQTTLFVLLLAFVLGQFVGWIYMWTHRGLSYSQTFVSSLVVIPVIVAVMMVLMAGSLVVAFGLLAVFAVVRFRNVLKDTRDTTFVLWAIMEGLAVGTQRFSTALMGAMGIAAVLLYLRLTAFGSRQRYDAVLTMQVLGDFSAAMAGLKETLHCHSVKVQMVSERRQPSGVVDISYCLLMRDPDRRDELRVILEKNQSFENVSLFVREDESEI
jgi:hypothetical protein